MSTAASQVPSRCGCVLPSVHEQIAVFGSAAEVEHMPWLRASRGQGETSTVCLKVILPAPSLVRLYACSQPSSVPLPLQPRQPTSLVTFGSALTTQVESLSWFIEQSSLFFA